jgi:hypothetical protein
LVQILPELCFGHQNFGKKWFNGPKNRQKIPGMLLVHLLIFRNVNDVGISFTLYSSSQRPSAARQSPSQAHQKSSVRTDQLQLQLFALPKTRAKKFPIWDVFKEFPISRSVLNGFD